MTITSAVQWADALEEEMRRTGQSAGDLISHGYANGQILGITLDPEHPEADDERAVIVSEQGWIVGYDAQSGFWTELPSDHQPPEPPRRPENPGGLAGLVEGLLGAGNLALGGQAPDNPSVCDWCNATPSWRYRTGEPVALPATRPTATTTFGDWYACDACRPLVDAADWDGLALRAGLPVPVPATVLNTWRAFGERRHDAEHLTSGS